MQTGPAKPLLRALAGETLSSPPWWLMRQAGRYAAETAPPAGRFALSQPLKAAEARRCDQKPSAVSKLRCNRDNRRFSRMIEL